MQPVITLAQVIMNSPEPEIRNFGRRLSLMAAHMMPTLAAAAFAVCCSGSFGLGLGRWLAAWLP